MACSTLSYVDKKEGDEGRKGSKYDQKALIAYIERQDGVVEGKSEWTRKSAWLAWRSGSLE
jgi:NADH:ubiquinone reductase (non-electrogenic)